MSRILSFFFSGFLMTSVSTALLAQDPQFSQYYAAPLYLNPGLAGINQAGSMGINFRSQWPSLDANFETFSAYADYNFTRFNSSVGFLATRDKEGIAGLQSTNFSFQYAYQVQLSKDVIFRPGFQVGTTIRDLNFNRLTFGDQFGPNGIERDFSNETFDAGLNASFLDLAIGAVFYTKTLWLGGAVHHLNEPNQSLTGDNVPLALRISFHGGFRIPLEDPVTGSSNGKNSFSPTFNYRRQGDFEQLDLGAYLTLDPILVGMWYRGVPAKGLEGTSNTESYVFLFGIQKNRTTYGYSFDYTVSDLGISTGGAHEISISYAFDLSDPKAPKDRAQSLQCPIPIRIVKRPENRVSSKKYKKEKRKKENIRRSQTLYQE